MTPGEVFLLGVRWLHTLAAVAWVGGSLFLLLVLRPALRREGRQVGMLGTLASREFRGLVDTCIVVLIITGVVLAFDRLTSPATGTFYVATLGFKATLGVWMFALAWGLRRPHRTPVPNPTAESSGKVLRARRLVGALSGANLILILGIVVFLVSDLLRTLFEQGIGSR